MKTINATVVHHGQSMHVFAFGETNFFGKLRGGISVGVISENRETRFTESLNELMLINAQITETLQELRAKSEGLGGLIQNRSRIAELSNMQDLFVRIFKEDDCTLQTSAKRGRVMMSIEHIASNDRRANIGPPVPPKPSKDYMSSHHSKNGII